MYKPTMKNRNGHGDAHGKPFLEQVQIVDVLRRNNYTQIFILSLLVTLHFIYFALFNK